MAIEIVHLPIDGMVIFHSYVSLPEGIWNPPWESTFQMNICGIHSYFNRDHLDSMNVPVVPSE